MLFFLGFNDFVKCSEQYLKIKMQLRNASNPLYQVKKYYFFFVTTLISSGSGLGPETLVLEVIPAAVTVERLGTIHKTRLL